MVSSAADPKRSHKEVFKKEFYKKETRKKGVKKMETYLTECLGNKVL